MDKLTPFDKLTSTPDLQLIKLLIPYISPYMRQTIAVFIKFTELKNTMQYFSSRIPEKEEFSGMQIFEEILPYMPNELSEQFEQMKGMMEMMQGQDLSDMFQMFSQEGADSNERMDESSEF